jgi:hypothetical protein
MNRLGELMMNKQSKLDLIGLFIITAYLRKKGRVEERSIVSEALVVLNTTDSNVHVEYLNQLTPRSVESEKKTSS